MSDRFIIQGIMFDQDGTVTISYMDKESDLRESGSLFQTTTVCITPESILYPDVKDIMNDLEDLVIDVRGLFRDTPAWVPEDSDTEDDEDRGMGF